MASQLDLDSLQREVLAAAEPGLITRPFGTRVVALAEDAWPLLAACLDELSAREVVVVTDGTPKTRGGEPLLAGLRAILPRSTRFELLMGEVHATQAEAEALGRRIADARVLLSVGSGAVTDLTKSARDHAAPDAALICLPTAASVTAYTSALTVLMVDGVKRTLPARAPDYVFCDLTTLSEAPAVMTRAGFGDVMARSVSYGDWWLASRFGLDDGFSVVPGVVMGQAEQAMVDRAAEVAAGSLAGVRAVAEGVLRAGLAMSVVNQTAPLSGWEHVISHWLDMTAEGWQRQPALHGEQVGVATLVAARAYERLWPALDRAALGGSLDPAVVSEWRAAITSRFARLPGGEAMAAEAWRDVSRKLEAWRAAEPVRRAFVARLDQAQTELDRLVRPAAQVETALRAAGAPTEFGQMSQPVPAEAAREAIGHAHLVRARLTLGDLLALGGGLDVTWLSRP